MNSPHYLFAIPAQLKKLMRKFTGLQFLCTLIYFGIEEESCVRSLALVLLFFSLSFQAFNTGIWMKAKGSVETQHWSSLLRNHQCLLDIYATLVYISSALKRQLSNLLSLLMRTHEFNPNVQNLNEYIFSTPELFLWLQHSAICCTFAYVQLFQSPK